MRLPTSRGIVLAFLGLFAAQCVATTTRAADATSNPTQIADATPRQDLLAALPPKPNQQKPTLRTRFVIGLERKVEYQVFSLSKPNRVVVELPDVKLYLPPHLTENKPVGVVRSFRGGLAAFGKTRIVIDVTQPVIVEHPKIEKTASGGWQLALDILPVEAAYKADIDTVSTAPAGSGHTIKIQPPTPKLAESPKEREARMFKPIIVLDPGHGGLDSGAVKRGTVEKDVVLAFAHVLRKELESTGRYKVLMTRDKDVFIELDERRAYAERNRANLFIAIHADYANTRARGATIFSLRDGVAKALQRNAADRASRNLLSDDDIRLVKQASGNVDAVRSILADLAERDVRLTHERSNVFAKTVIENMSESTTMRNEPDQQAAFRVLKTAQFPSVLIELAYVSNQQDASNLKSDEWREKVADSIVMAIDNYFSNQLARLPM